MRFSANILHCRQGDKGMTNERILAFARMTRKEDGDGKAGKTNAKMPGQAGHDSGRGWDDNRTTPLLVLSRLAASA